MNVAEPKAPLVSVIMPVYNAEAYVAETIKSILNQSFTDFEFLILNDGSTDNSGQIIQSFSDPRIRYLTQENSGIVDSLNRLVQEARGTFWARMDADDLAHPDRLKKQVEWLIDHPDDVMVCCVTDWIDENGRPLTRWPADDRWRTFDELCVGLFSENAIAHSSVLLRGDVLKQSGLMSRGELYRTMLALAEDYDLWLRLLVFGYRFHKLGEPLMRLRRHSKSLTLGTTGLWQLSKDLRVKASVLLMAMRTPRLVFFKARLIRAFLFEFARFCYRAVFYYCRRIFCRSWCA